jgi:hypothetical protein
MNFTLAQNFSKMKKCFVYFNIEYQIIVMAYNNYQEEI